MFFSQHARFWKLVNITRIFPSFVMWRVETNRLRTKLVDWLYWWVFPIDVRNVMLEKKNVDIQKASTREQKGSPYIRKELNSGRICLVSRQGVFSSFIALEHENGCGKNRLMELEVQWLKLSVKSDFILLLSKITHVALDLNYCL